MKKRYVCPALFLIIIISISADKDRFHGRFIENFDGSASEYFNAKLKESEPDNRYVQGVNSKSEKGTTVMVLRIDPEAPVEPINGTEIISKNFTHFGSYSARLKIPDVSDIQPDVGAVVGYFTYSMDNDGSLSEIDFEWLIADPEIIYIGTWTGWEGNLLRTGRTINLAEGVIYNNSLFYDGTHFPLKGKANMPETIQPIENYNAASQFYTYGFDWHPDSIRWWMLHPATADTIVLWNYSGSIYGIPEKPSHYRLNFWHTDEWAVETRPNSVERPLYPYELEVDWMSYYPF